MSVITRLPVAGPPATGMPDPSQRLALLRDVAKVRNLALGLGATAGAVLAVGAVAAAGRLDAPYSSFFWVTPLLVHVAMLVMNWRETRRLMAAAVDVQPPVLVVRPDVRGTLVDLLRTPIALIALGCCGICVASLLLDPQGWMGPGMAVGFAARVWALDALMARSERRDERRYLLRIDLPEEHDLLHATPGQVLELSA